jgi:hypothetical protein
LKDFNNGKNLGKRKEVELAAMVFGLTQSMSLAAAARTHTKIMQDIFWYCMQRLCCLHLFE